SFSRGDGASDHGKWWVADDQLCQQWSSWMDGKSYCYKLTRNGSTVQWVRNDGRSGTARIGGEARQPTSHRSLIVQEALPGGSSAFRGGSVMRVGNRRAERRRRAQTQLSDRCR